MGRGFYRLSEIGANGEVDFMIMMEIISIGEIHIRTVVEHIVGGEKIL